jgi:raffinose/stachyose/melibiose transport system permease protein
MRSGRVLPFVKIILISLAAVVFLFPLLFVFLNSFKPIGEIVSKPLSLPRQILISNYLAAWNIVDFPVVFFNTVLITLFSLLGILLFSSMTAYWHVRRPSLFSKILTSAIILSMLVPFASIMIPLVKLLGLIGINNTLFGAILTYWGIGLAFAYFIMRGAVLSLPVDMEEAARIDGSGTIPTFFTIVLPLLSPTVLSVLIMDGFWIWNDFIVPLIVINNPKLSTIQLAVNRLFGMYNSRWEVALPALVLSMIPILAVFITAQKRIMSGIISGAVKG